MLAWDVAGPEAADYQGKLPLAANELTRSATGETKATLASFAYGWGLTVLSQVVMAEKLKRITASAKEQK